MYLDAVGAASRPKGIRGEMTVEVAAKFEFPLSTHDVEGRAHCERFEPDGWLSAGGNGPANGIACSDVGCVGPSCRTSWTEVQDKAHPFMTVHKDSGRARSG